jgi:G3E family GTPase
VVTPVTVLTGFLGAGKTTLLAALLRRPELAGTAVFINEVGAIAIDHHLVRDVKGDAIVLASGCVCCTVAGDLIRAMLELAAQVARGEVPPCSRALVETTGLADPTGVLAAVVQHPLVARHYEAGAVVTVVDGQLGLDTLRHQPESVAQVALADRLVITKTDVASPEAIDTLEAALREKNHGATIVRAANGAVDPDVLFAPAPDTAYIDAATRRPVTHAFISTFTVCFAKPVRMGPLGLWLTLITQMHAGSLLRVKGIVNVEGEDAPVVIDCVQHVIHPARQLASWPDDDRRTRLVFIARGLAASTIASMRVSISDSVGQPLVD